MLQIRRLVDGQLHGLDLHAVVLGLQDTVHDHHIVDEVGELAEAGPGLRHAARPQLRQRGPHAGHVHVEVPQLGREAATRPGAEAVQAAQTVLLHWNFTSLQAVLILLSIVNVPYITLILFLC